MPEKLGRILIERGVIEEQQLTTMLAEQSARGGELLGRIGVSLGYYTEEQLGEALARQWNMPFVKLGDLDISAALIECVSPEMARQFRVVPIQNKHGELRIATDSPQKTMEFENELSFQRGGNACLCVATESEISNALRKYYRDDDDSEEGDDSKTEVVEVTFQFEAIDEKTGREVRGKVRAAREAEATAKIRASGLMVVRLSVYQSTPEPANKESIPVAEPNPRSVTGGSDTDPYADATQPPRSRSGGQTGREYKVLTQKDKWFSGKFDPQRLEKALNDYASMGWRVCGVSTAQFTGALGGSREEMVIFLERTHHDAADRA